MFLRVDEQRLLERGFADFEVVDLGHNSSLARFSPATTGPPEPNR
jgi:hypothetical protein